MANYKLANNVFTTLVDSITNSATEIDVNNASDPFNSPPSLAAGETGILTLVDSTKDPTKIEIITYDEITDNGDGTLTLSGVSRGLEGTGQQIFSEGSYVLQSLTTGITDMFITGLGSSSIDDLIDVDTTTNIPSAGSALIWDESESEWVPGYTEGSIDPSLSSNMTFSGITSYETMLEPVSFGNVLYYDITSNGYRKAKSNPLSDIGTPADAMALDITLAGQTCRIMHFGYVRYDSWSWATSAADENLLYVSTSTSGEMQQDIPSDGFIVNVCAMVRDYNIIKFTPSMNTVQVAAP